jgi:hypothetical protein
VILATAGLVLLIVVSAFLLTPLVRAAIRQRAMLTVIASAATTILVGFVVTAVRILFRP